MKPQAAHDAVLASLLRFCADRTRATGSAQTLRDLYARMVTARAFETAAVRLGALTEDRAVRGEEAVAAGVGAALGPRDVLVAGYGEHAFAAASGLRLGSLPLPRAGHYHARAGLGLDPAVRFLRGVDFGPSRVAVVRSLAVEDRLRGDARRVLCVVRDAEVEAEDFLDVLGVAIEWRLPVVFVCSYNQYRPLAARTLYDHARALDVAADEADGMNAAAVHSVVSRALDEAPRGAGPRVVEALTYYPERSIESLPPACDPVQLLRRHGVSAGVLTPAEFDEVHRAALDAGANEALRWREAQAARVTG